MAAPPLIAGLQVTWLGTLLGAWRRFRQAARHPEAAQLQRLRALLPALAGGAYGRAHRLDRATSLAGFRERLPVVGYPELAPWIARVEAGERGVLTADPVLMLERTGGSTAANKLIPYTAALRAEFAAATGAWLFELHRRTPGLIGTRSYWSVSPATRGREVTPGGLPVGFEDDTEYFGPVERWAIRRLLAVPPTVARLPDMAAWRRTTLHYLLACPSLGLLSVWSPTFLTRLMESLDSNLETHLQRLPPPRRDQLRRGLDRAGTLQGEALWPALQLISCWTEGASATFLPALRRYFPRTPIQPKGLLATEGVVSFPFGEGPGAVAALTSHLLEFEDLESPGRPARLAHELRQGGRYAPLLTTGGGLIRYRLGDVVRCTGHLWRCPRLVFEGRLDCVSDLCGEKIHAQQVERALARASAALALPLQFALVAPWVGTGADAGPPAYCLFVEPAPAARAHGPEADLEALRAALEDALAEGHHYRYARDLGQLGPMRLHRVVDGWRRFERALVSRGARAGDVKPTHLDTRLFWPEVFGQR